MALPAKTPKTTNSFGTDIIPKSPEAMICADNVWAIITAFPPMTTAAVIKKLASAQQHPACVGG